MFEVSKDTLGDLMKIADVVKRINENEKSIEFIRIQASIGLTKIIIGDKDSELHITDVDDLGYKVEIPNVCEVNGWQE